MGAPSRGVSPCAPSAARDIMEIIRSGGLGSHGLARCPIRRRRSRVRAYVGWIRRFLLFHGPRHPSEMGQAEVTAFLSHLATDRGVSAATQNQALSALLFLYRDVYGRVLEWMRDVVRAKRPSRLPEVLSR